MISKIVFWLNCSRAFALPVTIMSWFVAFIFAFLDGGNLLNGFIALLGVSFAHLAANIFDDYFDYKLLVVSPEIMNSAQVCKCRFIRDGSISLNKLLFMGVLFLLIAAFLGLILAFLAGVGVIWVAFLAAFFIVFYSKFTLIGLGELAVFLVYGPLLFEGVFYSMKMYFSFDMLILSFAVASFVVAFLYTHTLLDYDGDLCAHKKTLACAFENKNIALLMLFLFYALGFACTILFAFISHNYFILISFLTLPLVVRLYNSLVLYIKDKNSVPEISWWYYPLDNWKHIVSEGSQSFYLRLFLARNINTYFSFFVCFSLILEKIF